MGDVGPNGSGVNLYDLLNSVSDGRRWGTAGLTIAACYVSPEGVVFGADSTTTYGIPGGSHYYNHAQKLFEIGEDSTLGLVTWGLGGLAIVSYRKLIAVLSDDLENNSLPSVLDVAERWAKLVRDAYEACDLRPYIDECRHLDGLAARDADQEERLRSLRAQLFAGFCIGGYVLPDRTPSAALVQLDPITGCTGPDLIAQGYGFWGAPNVVQRLLHGCDDGFKASILSSQHWTGTDADLEALVSTHVLAHPTTVPMREAIDFVHYCIHSTIKAMKFSSLPQICGGQIEMAVITVDRRFRWVRHKSWDTAINEAGGYDG